MLILSLFRPFAVALGLFVVLNAGASMARPSLGAARLVVNLPVAEPYLSVSLLLVAAVLLFPPRSPLLQEAALAVLCMTALVVLANIVRFYALLYHGLIRSALPVPFSCVVLAVVVAEGLRLYLGKAGGRWISVLQLCGVPPAFVLLVAGHIVTFGNTDYRYLREARAAVVLGARVNADWSLSLSLASRLQTAVELFRQGRVRYLILSGGTGRSGVNEAEAMERVARAAGVPADRLVLDRQGNNTFASAVNCAAICHRYGWKRLMVVSQYFHLARSKLIFERQGLQVLTVPARTGEGVRRSFYYLIRETVALPYYYLRYTFAPAGRGGALKQERDQ